MSFRSPKTFLLDGQQIIYVEDSKVVRFAIHEPFFKAGHILGWDISRFGSVGLGINHAIIKFLERSRSKLIIHIDSESYDCVITYDALSKFIKNEKNWYPAGGKKFVHVIPLSLYKGYPKKVRLEV